jgi:uncharacterized protein (TIRG00374 family)
MKHAIKWVRRSVFLLGAVVFAVLLSEIGPGEIARLLERVGWGIVLVLAQEAVTKLVQARAWSLAFPAGASSKIPLRRLFTAGIVGDGINYLVPSATVAGEVARVERLAGRCPTEEAAASVLVARFAEMLGQWAFIAAGFLLFVSPRLLPGSDLASLSRPAAAALAVLAAALLVYAAAGRSWIGVRVPRTGQSRSEAWLPRVPDRLKGYFRDHPLRFAGSILLYAAAWAWGAFEAYWICRFLGFPVSVSGALAIEALSAAIDSLLFFVPAKVGSQELGKVAVFTLLGLPRSAGFAFGIVRHVRELAWAGMGLALSAARRPANIFSGAP